METKEITETEVKTEPQKEETKDNFIVAYIKDYAKKYPKKTFFIMVALIVVSIISSTIRYVMINREEPIKVSLANKSMDGVISSISSPIKATQNVLAIKKIMDELDFYRHKKVLSKEDSIRVKYLIDKSKTLRNEK